MVGGQTWLNNGINEGAGLVYPQVARNGPEGVELFASLVTDKFNEKC